VITKPWAWSFSFKCYIALICDLHSVFHLTELFRTEFPDGDDHARGFLIINPVQTLFSYWDNGCGLFDIGVEAVNQMVDYLLGQYRTSPYNDKRMWTEENWNTVRQSTVSLTKESGYGDLRGGYQMGSAYIEKARSRTLQQVAYAGYAIASVMERIAVPVFDREQFAKMPVHARLPDLIGWTLFLVLFPPTVLTVCRLRRPPET
jgi:hypothetical protein